MRKPQRPLDEYVECLWHFAKMPPRLTERIVPSGAFELVINLEEDEIRIYDPPGIEHFSRFSGAAAAGAYQSFFLVDILQRGPILGAHFKPGGAFPFFGGQTSEMADTHVDLDTLWGVGARGLRERIGAASTAESRLQILEQALLSRLSQAGQLRGEVSYALRCLKQSSTPIAELAKEVGLSHRRFIEIFTAQVGTTPSHFRRVRRFQRATRIAGRASEPNWGELSLECGYFDQSHMIRDFQAFSGYAPADYVQRLNEQMKENHISDM